MKIELEIYDLTDLLQVSPVTRITENFITLSIGRPDYLRGDIEIRMNVKHGLTHETRACCLNFYDFQHAKEETKREILEYTLNDMTRYFKEVFG